MKNKSFRIVIFSLMAFSSLYFLDSCTSNEPSLSQRQQASFSWKEITPTSDTTAQNVLLINTSSPRGIAYWNVPGIGNYKGDTVKTTVVFKGTYKVNLVIAGQGGISDTLKQTITINNDNSFAIGQKSLLNILTNAKGVASKVWYAPRILDVCVVGPDVPTNLAAIAAGGGAWWGFGQGEITTDGTGRDGYLDDTYTFFFSQAYKFAYDDKGTTFLDGGGSNWTKALAGTTTVATTGSPIGTPYKNAVGNYATSGLYTTNSGLAAWGPGNFTYSINLAPAGAQGLGQITVNGVGAHLAMQDKTPSGDLVLPSVSSITYDIQKINLNLTDSGTGKVYDQIIIGFGNWSFVLRSDH